MRIWEGPGVSKRGQKGFEGSYTLNTYNGFKGVMKFSIFLLENWKLRNPYGPTQPDLPNSHDVFS